MAKGKYEKWLTPEGLLLIEGWKRDGLSDEQVAKNMGVSRSTLNDWIKRFPDISDAIKRNREIVIREVENALVKRARGFSYTEETKERKYNNRTGEFELVVTKSVQKTVPPDVGAIAFYLKNVAPDKWRDKQNIELSSQQDDMAKMDDILKQMGMIEADKENE